VITEQRLVEASEHFEAAAHGDRAMLRAFCEHKAGEVSGAEAETWAFLRILFEDNATECVPLIDCRPSEPPCPIVGGCLQRAALNGAAAP